MKDAVFTVTPAGICGMNELAKFLNTMKDTRAIADWEPGHAESGSLRERYIVRFLDEPDAKRAEQAWSAARRPAPAK